MASILRGFRAFWKGSGPPIPPKNKHPPPWPCPRPPRFRPTRPPKPTTLVGKIKSYIPSRRWLIAGGIIGAWIGLAAYDRRERKRAVERWCKKVEHLSRRTIQFSEDVPSIAIWIGAPPGDQLKWNKEVWRDYVKPIVIAAGFDYSLHLNAKQAVTRTAVREMIMAHRVLRDPSMKGSELPTVRELEGGDVVIVGRNTFKEVVRGINEGYLLPLDYEPPAPPPPEPPKEDLKDGAEKKEDPQPPPKDPALPPIPVSEYSSLPDPPNSLPEYIFTYIPSLHILGFRNTPRRIYRFLTRRYVADEICEQVVACILEQEKREWTDEDIQHGQGEERFWPKVVKPDAEWRESLYLDPRIRPTLFWRVPSEVHEIPDYREASAPEEATKVEDLQPTEEEIERDRRLREQAALTSMANRYTIPYPFGRR